MGGNFMAPALTLLVLTIAHSVAGAAYAPVGRTGDYEPEGLPESKANEEAQSHMLAGGIGWISGFGCCVGPFLGVGVGVAFPFGVVYGAGIGIGVMVGAGTGTGLVWGSGRGKVNGFAITGSPNLPAPPTASELRAQVSSTRERLQRTAKSCENLLSRRPRVGRALRQISGRFSASPRSVCEHPDE
uniref:Uncharacterized protein n=1 Tax=Coccolithus braarudii TaxID=221442 RepID=A0A7S0L6M9_9EUKA